MADNDLAGLVRTLERDPIFVMSLNSKELFHSNLLAWLVRSFPAVAETITENSKPVMKVTREEGHTDLAIHQPDTLTIMELKTFALPERDQLNRLAERFSQHEPQLILLTLSPPLWREDTWQVVTYEQLAARLQPIVPAVQAADSYAGATMARWLHLLRMLHELAAHVGKPGIDEPLVPQADVLELLGPARLAAAVVKMRSQHVAAELRLRQLAANAGYTRGSGIIEWGIDGKHDYGTDGAGLVWGWQLQGLDFRLAMITPKGHPGHGDTSGHKAIRHQVANEHLDYFAFEPLDGAKLGPASGFNTYNPAMVYRYMKVPGLTVGQAVELGTEYAARARAYALSLRTADE